MVDASWHVDQLAVDEALVARLLGTQFPQWSNLPVRRVEKSGCDNRTFRLGEQSLVRLPSAECYAPQVQREHRWLPVLTPNLPLPIPTPLAIGRPEHGYPCSWSVYRWIEGQSADRGPIADLTDFARSLAQFLDRLQSITPDNGPPPGSDNFFRGGDLCNYDQEAQRAFAALPAHIDVAAARRTWATALASRWHRPPVWVHGDVSAGNLLVSGGTLSAVIDFGLLCVGDPACDLVVAWTLFDGNSRKVFRSGLSLDSETWARARGWALWKAAIVATDPAKSDNSTTRECWRIIDAIVSDH